jgi:hypothetical protein
MKLDFSVLDAPVRAADKLEAEWCVPVAPRAPDRSSSFSTRAALTESDLNRKRRCPPPRPHPTPRLTSVPTRVPPDSAAEVTSDVHAQNFKLPLEDDVRPLDVISLLGFRPEAV